MKNVPPPMLCRLAIAVIVTTLLITSGARGEPRLLGGDLARFPEYQQAGSEGALLELTRGVTLRLEPEAQLSALPIQHLNLPGQGATRVFPFVLRSGRADVRIAPRTGQPVAVLMSTSKRVMGAATEGTATFVSQPSGLLVANVDGSVLGLQKSGWERVPRFEARHYASLERAAMSTALLGAPLWSRSSLILVASRTRAPLLPVEWSEVVGAAAYEVDVPTESGARRLVRSTEPRAPSGVELTRGRHRVRCRAVDRRGAPGRWSEALSVWVVGVSVPPGAVVEANGTIGLGPNQKISFVDAEGLVMWHRATHRTVPASTQVGLVRGEPTLVALRVPGTLDFTLVRLMPRKTRAIVRAGPKDAFWPFDPIELKYRIDDGTGRSPAHVQAQVQVTLDAQPIEVNWRRSGAWMTARVRPRHGCGHCVVRVEVSDQHGIPLGRDSVEIVELPSRPRSAVSGLSER